MGAGEHLSKQFRSVYHGTGTAQAESILQTGLRPSVLGDTVTRDRDVAKMFANDWDNPEMGDEGVVIRARLPRRVYHGYVDEIGGHNPDRSHALRRTIPPKYLREV